MTNNDDRGHPHHRTPASIRGETFPRRMLGLDMDQVYEYLDLLADQVQAAENEHREIREENERLRTELGRAQAELAEHEQAGDRVNEQAVELFSQAQLVAEEMVEDMSRDARERLGQARAHERKIVEEAMSSAGQQVRSYAREAQTQMQSIMDSFASDVDRVGGARAARDSAAPHQNDPLRDDLSDGQLQYRGSNGNGQHSPGSD